MKNRILVIGGTGTVGSEVVKELQKNGGDFKVLSRSKDKAEALNTNGIATVVGTLGEWRTVEPILYDVDTLFLATSPSEDMLELHKGMIDLAVKSGIKKIVRLSAEPANYSKGLYMYEQHQEADDYLKNSGVNYVILQPHYFMQNVMMMHFPSVKSGNVFSQYSGYSKIPMIDVRDIAKVAYQGLIKNDFDSQSLILTGPNSISYEDISKTMSENLGRDIQFSEMPYEDQEAGFKQMGMPDWQLSTVLKLLKQWADKEVSPPSDDFERVTGSKATSIDKFIKDHIDYLR